MAAMKTDVVSPTADIFIASLYSAPKNEPILRSLLTGVMTDIGEPAVTKATVLNPFNIQDYPADKQIRLDVLVEDESRAFYNVEVQVDPHTGFFDRMLYYWAEVYGSLLERGEKYNQLLPVRTVIITEFPVFPMLQRLHAVFELRSRENPDVLFSKHCQIHVLRLGDLKRNDLLGLDQFGLDLQRWLQFWALGEKLEEATMTAMLQDCPPVQAAYKEYRQFAADPAMREKARARQRFLDEQAIITAQAEARGAAKEKTETAFNMIQEGFDKGVIAKITGLPLLEIERLK